MCVELKQKKKNKNANLIKQLKIKKNCKKKLNQVDVIFSGSIKLINCLRLDDD